MNLTPWKYYLRFYHGKWPKLALALALAMGQSAMALPIAFLVRNVFDRIIPAGNWQTLVLSGVAIVVLYLGSGGLNLLNRRLTLLATKRAIYEMRAELLAKCCGFSRAFYAGADRGQLHSAIVQDSERLDVMSNALVGLLLPALAVGTVLAVVLIYLNVRLFILLVFFIPVLFWVNHALRKRLKKRVNAFRYSFESFSKGVWLLLQMLDLVHSHSTEEYELHRQKENIEKLRKSSGDMAWMQAAYSAVQGGIATAAGIFILVVGGRAILAGSMSFGSLLSFYVAALLLNGQLQLVLAAIPQIIAGSESLRALHLLSQTHDSAPYAGRRRIDFQGRIKMEGVFFQYGEAPLLRDINLEMKPEVALAIVGANGSGKTTIAYLILGFYRPLTGRLSADGQPYVTLDLGCLRRQIGVVMQDPVLFPGTVWENVTYGCPSVGRKEVERAAALVSAQEFISALPQGYETVVGHEGTLLSGGQRQCIALMRAVLRRPTLLILDEPTNHLDEAAADDFLGNLKKMDPAPATLIISHDLRITAAVKHVFMLQDGRLAAMESAYPVRPAWE
jgi:ABC-type multidrug transport system fused ATPase/permease subunit